jgi:hypothetical protein
MFSHLKPEEFVNLLEGVELPSRRQAHLKECERCRTTWQSMQPVHSGVSTLHDDIVEPDWSEFRSSVRNELLSRSVQRTSALRRWTGWSVRPAAAWALSLLLTAGITGGALLWWIGSGATEPSLPPAPAAAEVEEQPPLQELPVQELAQEPPAQEPLQFTGMEEELHVWSRRGLFDELASLEENQQEQLRELLESAQLEMAVR